MPNLNGGPLCGDVRYSASNDPVTTSICHCRQCQKQTGSAFVEVVAVNESDFSVQGKPQSFTYVGDSGRKKLSKFCPRCSMVVFIEAEGLAGRVLIMGGTLDDPSWPRPAMALFCEAAQPWIASRREMTECPRMPT
jgi:hypothetical protein